jgi:anti-repressor protein
MSAVELFTYTNQEVRVIVLDGAPWFVLADLCRVLGLVRGPAQVAERLDDEVRQTYPIPDSLGRVQETTIVSESGMYEVVIRSDKPEAVAFRRWITGEVLPSIRKTGGYNAAPALEGPELLARAVLEAQAMLAAKDERIAELEPQAQVATKLLDAEGDLSVRDAAQSLTRAGVKVGAGRLFGELERRGWIKRAMGDGRYRVIQSAIETGYMSVLPQSHYHPRTCELILDPPQPRVRPKGLQKLLNDLGGAL